MKRTESGDEEGEGRAGREVHVAGDGRGRAETCAIGEQ